ncbi:MAG: CRISPR-associated endonuclease Cas1 [Gammaproteobacteria bacterium]|nr:CRISPR-associated endonuclease Cas1 [Gammaproteobacteria bacterium]
MWDEIDHRWNDETPGPRKPLYLRGNPGMRVEADGPALRVRQPAKAALLFPLTRVVRVVSSGAVQWEGEALLACAEAAVPVVFLYRDGAVRAYLFGKNTRARDPHDLLYSRLRARLTRPNGMKRYDQWRRTMTQAAVQALHEQWGSRFTEHHPGRLRQDLAVIRQRYAGPGPAELIDARLHGLLVGLSAELLAEVGLDAQCWPKLDFAFDLAGDLADLLRWALERPVSTALEAHYRGGADAPYLVEEAQLIALFERAASDLRRLGLDALRQLRQMLET